MDKIWGDQNLASPDPPPQFEKPWKNELIMTDENLEIYRQRYEAFRHFDKLRWQMLQILVAIASATALLLRYTAGTLEWWFFCLLGASLLVIGFVMIRIGNGIRANNKVLKKAAKAIGDNGIPTVSNSWKSVAHWISVLVMALGALLLATSIWMAICRCQ